MRVGTGATLVIGGLLQSEEAESIAKVPLLGDLPVLGALFRSKVSTHGNGAVVFITPWTFLGQAQVDALSVFPQGEVSFLTDKIRVLIADDVEETRETIARLLSFEEDIQVVGMAADGQEAVTMTRRLLPDCVLMDINMPGLDGLTATQLISVEAPPDGHHYDVCARGAGVFAQSDARRSQGLSGQALCRR